MLKIAVPVLKSLARVWYLFAVDLVAGSDTVVDSTTAVLEERHWLATAVDQHVSVLATS